MRPKFKPENLEGRDNLGDLDVDERIVFKRILNNPGGGV
jgi:hypothetical protein